MRSLFSLLTALSLYSSSTVVSALEQQRMTASRMLDVLRSRFPEAQARGSRMTWSPREDVEVTLVFDEHADRMRLISPIGSVASLSSEQLLQALEANFHTTLDVRYAVSQNLVWAAFLHPLSSLPEDLLLTAVDQVVAAQQNFGGSYSAGSWVFGGGSSSLRSNNNNSRTAENMQASAEAAASSADAAMDGEHESFDEEAEEEEGEDDLWEFLGEEAAGGDDDDDDADLSADNSGVVEDHM